MKMGFGIWFGVLLVLIGASVILEVLFNIHIPLIRTAFALFLIYLGAKMLMGAWSPARQLDKPEGLAVMSDSTFTPREPARSLEYNVIFSRGTIDLTALPLGEGTTEIEVNTVFGASFLKVDPKVALEIQGSSAFGEVRLPNRSSTPFGTTSYRPAGQESAPVKLRVKLNVVFGFSRVEELGEATGSARLGTLPPAQATR